MKKQIACAALSLTLALGMTTPASASHHTDTVDQLVEQHVTASVVVNGVEQTDFHADAYDGTTYASLYYTTQALRPDAAVAWEEDRLVARADDFILSARIGSKVVEVNGRCLYVPDGVRKDETGDTLVPTRTLATALGAEVGWDNGVVFTLAEDAQPLTSGEAYYDAETLDLLSRVIMHESGNQPLEGKIAVGNVILNRVEHHSFPGTVAEVLYQPGQFPGATDATPNAESILAAKLCLDGAETVPGAYWFNGAGKACWASRNKGHIATIGGHSFYG